MSELDPKLIEKIAKQAERDFDTAAMRGVVNGVRPNRFMFHNFPDGTSLLAFGNIAVFGNGADPESLEPLHSVNAAFVLETGMLVDLARKVLALAGEEK